MLRMKLLLPLSGRARHGALACLAFAALVLGAGALPARAQEKASQDKPAPAKPARPEPPAEYRLKAGDEISVSVTPQNKYDCAGIVLPDGRLFLKGIGEVKAAGMSVNDLQKRVFKYLDEFLVNPTVVVTVSRVAPDPPEPMPEPVKMLKVTVVGGVVKPGPLEVEDGARVRKAIDVAGGSVKEANLKEVLIIHADQSKSLVDLSSEERLSDPAHNRILKEGDSVEVRLVPEKKLEFVRIDGAVTAPSQYELTEGMTLQDLITKAGKMSLLADVKRVQLQRKGSAVEEVDLVEQQKLGLKGQIYLRDGDKVFIPEQVNTVLLVGAVPNPGPLPLIPGQKVRDFFLGQNMSANGALDENRANITEAQLIRPNQETVKINLRETLKNKDSKSNIELQAGDTIYLPARKQDNGLNGALRFVPYIGVLASMFRFF